MTVQCAHPGKEQRWRYVTVVLTGSIAASTAAAAAADDAAGRKEQQKQGLALSLCEVVVLGPDTPQSLGRTVDLVADVSAKAAGTTAGRGATACRDYQCLGCDAACAECGAHGCVRCIDGGRAFRLRDTTEWAAHAPCQPLL